MPVMETKAEKKEAIVADAAAKVEKLFEAYDKTPKYKKPPKKKAKTGEADSPHIADLTTLSGNLTKGVHAISDESKIDMTYYAWNGWNYLGDAECPENRKIYKKSGDKDLFYEGFSFYHEDFPANFNQCYTGARIRKKTAQDQYESEFGAVEYFERGKSASAEAVEARKKRVAKKSYLLRAITLADRKQGQIGQTMPYRWQAHHILPMSSFTEFFTMDELRIILMSNYDINHGSNIIFLPARRQFMWVHQLPGHWSDHPQYTMKLRDAFDQKVRNRIKKIIKKQKPCEQSVADEFEKQLHGVEESQFDLLVDLGPQRLV